MTWKSIEQEEEDLIMMAIEWLGVRKRWDPTAEYYPTNADISKSALLERMRNGLRPLNFPPPIGYSCPWYAIVEDSGPHAVSYGGPHAVSYGGPHQDINFSIGKSAKNWMIDRAKEYGYEIVHFYQHTYEIYENDGDKDFIIRDTRVDPENEDIKSPYFFRLYWKPDHELRHVVDGKVTKEKVGAWLVYNTNFNL